MTDTLGVVSDVPGHQYGFRGMSQLQEDEVIRIGIEARVGSDWQLMVHEMSAARTSPDARAQFSIAINSV